MGLLSMIAELGVNINPFVTGLGKAKAEADRFAETAQKKFVGIGSGIRGTLTSALLGFVSLETIKRVGAYAGEVKSLAARMGTTVENAQALKFAAGDSIDAVAGAFKKIRVAQANAQTKEMSESWKTLGFEIEGVQRKRADQVFGEIIEKVKQGTLTNHEFAAALKIMGKNADEILPKLKKIGDKMDDFKKRGVGLTDAEIENARATKRVGEFGELLKLGSIKFGSRVIGLAKILSGHGGKFPGLENTLIKEKAEADLKAADAREREEAAAEATAERMKEERKQLEEIERIDERIRSLRLNTLTDDQKRASLRKELKELQQEAIEGFADPIEAKKNALAQAEAREKLFQLSKHPLDRLSADSLASAGTFIGGASSSANAPLVELGRAQLQAQQQIVRNTDPSQNVNSF